MKNCNTKRNTLQYAFLYMMFHFPSFVIDDNYELAKVVNEKCIFCINTGYERIKRKPILKYKYFKTINIESICA